VRASEGEGLFWRKRIPGRFCRHVVAGLWRADDGSRQGYAPITMTSTIGRRLVLARRKLFCFLLFCLSASRRPCHAPASGVIACSFACLDPRHPESPSSRPLPPSTRLDSTRLTPAPRYPQTPANPFLSSTRPESGPAATMTRRIVYGVGLLLTVACQSLYTPC
jgi:hypothetical protein